MACRYRMDAVQHAGNPVPALARHLATCQECQEIVRSQRRLANLLGEWIPPAVSSGFDARLWVRFEEQDSPAWWHLWRHGTGRSLMPMAAACFTVLLALLISVPWLSRPPTRAHVDSIDIEQVERVVDDMDLLQSLTPAATVAPEAQRPAQ